MPTGGAVPPPRPFTGGLIFWIVALCILFALVGRTREFRFVNFGPNGVGFFGSDYDYDVSAAAPAQGITRIVLDNLRGNVSLKGVDSVEVNVTGRQTVRAFNRAAADRAKSAAALHLERRGDDLVIGVGEFPGPGPIRSSADLDIVVPRGVSVESRGRSGDLTVEDVDGAVDVSNGRGDLRLSHIGKDVRIDATRGSDVHLESIMGPVTIKGEFSGDLEFRALAKPLEFTSSRTRFRVEAIPGTVSMDLGDLKMSNVSGPLRFQSGTRDIQVTDATGSLDLKVDRGDIGFTATQAPLPKVDIYTRNGDITLTLPESAGFQLDGSTHRGDIESTFGPSLQVQSSGRSATIKGRNGNGPGITVVTDRGTVFLKKI